MAATTTRRMGFAATGRTVPAVHLACHPGLLTGTRRGDVPAAAGATAGDLIDRGPEPRTHMFAALAIGTLFRRRFGQLDRYVAKRSLLA